MIMVDCEPILYDDTVRIRYDRPLFCPNCKDGLAMWRYGYRKRKVRDFRGTVHWLELPCYRCSECGRMFLTLPSFLIPFKQYDRLTIQKVQNGYSNGCGASYLSMYLWRRELVRI